MLHEETRFCIAGIRFEISYTSQFDLQALSRHISSFAVADDPDVVLVLSPDDLPDLKQYELLFRATPVWELRKGKEIQVLVTPSLDSSDIPTSVTVFNTDFTEGTSYYSRVRELPQSSRSVLSLGQLHLWMINLLNQGRGAIFHGCGVISGGRGLLFLGESGAGKTTTARLWASEEVDIVSDDRVIVRRGPDGRFWMYGTPWHGDAHAATPGAAPIDRVFLLRHAGQNHAQRISPAEALPRIVPLASLAYWSREGTDFTLGFLSELVQEVPFYDFGFTLSHDAVRYVQWT